MVGCWFTESRQLDMEYNYGVNVQMKKKHIIQTAPKAGSALKNRLTGYSQVCPHWIKIGIANMSIEQQRAT